jgi:hypothetical protein
MGGGRGGFDPNMTPEERRKRMEERLAKMTPEERQRWEQRMKEGGFGRRSEDGAQGSQGGNRDGGARQGQGQGQAGDSRWDARQGITSRATGGTSISSGATTIEELFAPLTIPERPGMAWVWADKQLKAVRLRHGISDGTWSEIVEGDLKEGQEVVTNISTGLEQRTTPGQGGNQNPLLGPQRGRGGPGGFGGGPGGGGGGGGRGGR